MILLARRLLTGILVMLVAASFAFALLWFAPGNPAEAILRQQRGIDPHWREVELFLARQSLDRPFLARYLEWLYWLSHGNLGVSLKTGEPVLVEFADRFGATLTLASAALAISVVVGVPLGVMAAVRANSWLDHAFRVFALGGISVPEFWLGLSLMLVFSLELGWLPCFGYGSAEDLILPAVTLGAGMTGSLMRLTRASVLEVLNLDYVRTARGKGLREWVVIRKHVLKNALIPVVTVAGTQFGHLLAGAVVVESVFSWPGIGKFLVDAVYARDYPVIQGFVLIIAALFVLINLLVDVIYLYLDPRIRYGGVG